MQPTRITTLSSFQNNQMSSLPSSNYKRDIFNMNDSNQRAQKKQGYPLKKGAYDRIDFYNVSFRLFYRNIVGCSDQYYCMSKKS